MRRRRREPAERRLPRPEPIAPRPWRRKAVKALSWGASVLAWRPTTPAWRRAAPMRIPAAQSPRSPGGAADRRQFRFLPPPRRGLQAPHRPISPCSCRSAARDLTARRNSERSILMMSGEAAIRNARGHGPTPTSSRAILTSQFVHARQQPQRPAGIAQGARFRDFQDQTSGAACTGPLATSVSST